MPTPNSDLRVNLDHVAVGVAEEDRAVPEGVVGERMGKPAGLPDVTQFWTNSPSDAELSSTTFE